MIRLLRDPYYQTYIQIKPMNSRRIKRIHIILIIGLIHGLIYVFLLPPWQHYDEPSHFEYAWLIANRLKLPQVGDYDQNMRLAVGKSLIASSFFAPENQPNLTYPSKPLWIGVSQLIDPPLYYVIEAVPLYFLKSAPIEQQMYVGRVISLLFLLLTIFSAYKITQGITPKDHPLRWMIPAFISMLPAFVEFMSSINDFVAAIGLFSLWLLVSVKLIKLFSLKYAGLLVILTIAGILTQKVLYPVIVYLPIVLLISIIPRKIRSMAWILTIIASIAAIFIVFNWGDAAFWLRTYSQDFPSRAHIQADSDTVYVLQGKVYPDANKEQNYSSQNSGFFQLVPTEMSNPLQGKTVTIGAWVWADKELSGYGPGLNSLLQFQERWFGFKQDSLDEKPRFIASVIQLPEQQERLQIWLRTTTVNRQDAIIYFSGIVLAEGAFPTDITPIFTDNDGAKGIWGNLPFTNLVRNAQFRHAWPYVEPKLLGILTSKIQDLNSVHLSSFISIFLDPAGTKWYTKSAVEIIFQTFWAKFCWGQVPLISDPHWLYPYRILLGFTLLGIISALFTGFQFVKESKHEFLFLLLIIITTIIMALFYGVYTMGGSLRSRAYFPAARYIFPAIIPLSLFLVIGWNGISTWASKVLKLPPQVTNTVYWALFIALDLYSFLSVFVYFNKS